MTGPNTHPPRRLLWGAALLVLLGLTVLWLRGATPSSSPAASPAIPSAGEPLVPAAFEPGAHTMAPRSGDHPGTAPPSARPAPPPSAAAAGDHDPGAPTRPPGPPEGADPSPDLAQGGPGEAYMKRYHGESGRLARGDPFELRHGPIREGRPGVAVELWTSKRRLEPGEKATLQVESTDRRTEILGGTVSLRIGDKILRRLPLVSVGHAASVEIQAEASFYPAPGADRGATAEPLLLELDLSVEVSTGGEPALTQHLSSMVFLQEAGGRLLPGTEQVALTAAGNAELTLEIEVRKPALYYLYAELWSVRGGLSIAFGRKDLGMLAAGRHRVSLIFGGKVVQDSGVNGPYAVRNVELSRVTTGPPHLAEPVAELLITPPWRASDFR